ncbi:MAG: hypothetical protein H6828_16535 [Planctomycetes bacterium]|nr:hypothetical protein [Planctomycetota bacterium]
MLKATIVVLLAALTGIAGWWTWMVRENVLGNEIELERQQGRISELEGELDQSQARVGELGVEVEEKKRRILELETRLTLLKVDHRVARLEVVRQGPDPADPKRTVTTVRFVEFGPDGETLGPGQEITLPGKKLYLDTQVVKFEDDYVEAGEFLRGTSLCLFRRMFSEVVAPEDGVALDQQGTHPRPYTGGDSEDELFHAELWQRFWDYANDAEAAAEKGVRAAHGEAPSIEARPGKVYRVELRASGGLTIRPD